MTKSRVVRQATETRWLCSSLNNKIHSRRSTGGPTSPSTSRAGRLVLTTSR